MRNVTKITAGIIGSLLVLPFLAGFLGFLVFLWMMYVIVVFDLIMDILDATL